MSEMTETCVICGVPASKYRRWRNDYYCAACYEQHCAEQERIAKEAGLCVKFGWCANNMFFLTRDVDEDTPVEIAGAVGLYHYGNQCLLDRLLTDKEAIDEFGCNYLDKMFIRLCGLIWVIETPFFIGLMEKEEVAFKSLSCRKDGDRYIVKVVLQDEVVEKELVEMVRFFEGRSGSVTGIRRICL